jgi:hypothetical protein
VPNAFSMLDREVEVGDQGAEVAEQAVDRPWVVAAVGVRELLSALGGDRHRLSLGGASMPLKIAVWAALFSGLSALEQLLEPVSRIVHRARTINQIAMRPHPRTHRYIASQLDRLQIRL